jgi:capsular polysaccharide biosynthesis protein
VSLLSATRRRILRAARRVVGGRTPPSAPTEPTEPLRKRYPAPRLAARVRAAALDLQLEYGVARPERTVDWSGLAYADGSPIDFAVPVPTKVPELGYGVFPRARVLTLSGVPVTAEGRQLIDAINVHEQSRYRAYSRSMVLVPAVELDGETINLATAFSTGNYGHGLLDGLGRLGLLSEAGYDFSRAAHVILPGRAPCTLRELVMRVGISEDRLIAPEKGANFACENLVQTTFPGRPRVYSDVIATFMRGLGVEPSGRDRRLLLLRDGDKRTVANRDEVAALAREYDLEIYDPRSSRFSPADFAAASLVVGAHGAGLADIVFCAPGTRVIEFLPSGHRYPYFATLSAASELRYAAVACVSVSGASHADFTVDVGAARAALDVALPQREA